MSEMPGEGGDLLVSVWEAMHRDSEHTTNTLIENLTRQAEDAEATLAAIRETIVVLLDGPYAPSASAIERALWPGAKTVDMFRRGAE